MKPLAKLSHELCGNTLSKSEMQKTKGGRRAITFSLKEAKKYIKKLEKYGYSFSMQETADGHICIEW